jgi:hypothetical protein
VREKTAVKRRRPKRSDAGGENTTSGERWRITWSQGYPPHATSMASQGSYKYRFSRLSSLMHSIAWPITTSMITSAGAHFPTGRPRSDAAHRERLEQMVRGALIAEADWQRPGADWSTFSGFGASLNYPAGHIRWAEPSSSFFSFFFFPPFLLFGLNELLTGSVYTVFRIRHFQLGVEDTMKQLAYVLSKVSRGHDRAAIHDIDDSPHRAPGLSKWPSAVVRAPDFPGPKRVGEFFRLASFPPVSATETQLEERRVVALVGQCSEGAKDTHVPCGRCAAGGGVFASCKVAFNRFGEPLGQGACMNCLNDGEEEGCSLRTYG